MEERSTYADGPGRVTTGYLADEAKRVGQIDAGIKEQIDLVDRLEKSAMILVERLQPVLNYASVTEGNENLPEVELVPLADKIRNNSRRIEMIVVLLNSVGQRIEL